MGFFNKTKKAIPVKVPIKKIKPEDEAGASWPAISIGAFVAFGGVLFGYDTGTISGIIAMPYWQTLFSTGYVDNKGHLDITPAQSSAVVSILSAGTFFGALASPFIADRIGRRWSLIVSCWVFNLGVILQVASTGLSLFLAGRFFAGFGVGLVSALSMLTNLYMPLETCANRCPQFLYTSQRRHRNGSVVPS
jgi:MFS family permease